MATTDLEAALHLPENEEELLAHLQDLCAEHAPSRFALCQLRETPLDGRVLAWGVVGDDGAMLYDAGGHVLGTFDSAEQARELLGRTSRLELVWVDPQPAPETPTSND